MDYHIVGIAGAGMSAIAHLLLDQGYTISGSDRQANRITVRLQQRGVAISLGHHASNGANAEVLIATSAVPDDHVELLAARAAGKPVLRRADVWRRWSQVRSIIAVAGTHGKSTTTALLTFLLIQAGYEPGFLIGAEFPLLGASARWGNSDAPLVIEADEYDHSFYGLFPDMAIITSMEWDHPDTYPTVSAYFQAFARFASQARYALVVSDQVSQDWRDQLARTTKRAATIRERDTTKGTATIRERDEPAGRGTVCIRTYGLTAGIDYYATPAQPTQPATGRETEHQHWHITYPNSNDHIPLALAIPGEHNVRNALAALGIAHLLGLDMYAAAESLAEFRGVARRFEIKGEVDGITIIDDYAHHPTEVAATLAAARQRYATRRILAYIQPHTYTRTLTLMKQWVVALAEADLLFIGAIYPSRESAAQAGSFSDSPNPQETVARHLVEQIAMHHPGLDVSYVGTIDEAPLLIDPYLVAGDVLITMGAGDGVFVGEQIVYRRSRSSGDKPVH